MLLEELGFVGPTYISGSVPDIYVLKVSRVHTVLLPKIYVLKVCRVHTMTYISASDPDTYVLKVRSVCNNCTNHYP